MDQRQRPTHHIVLLLVLFACDSEHRHTHTHSSTPIFTECGVLLTEYKHPSFLHWLYNKIVSNFPTNISITYFLP
jgi:hypothetical protein